MFPVSLPTPNSTSRNTVHEGTQKVAVFFCNRRQVHKNRFPVKGKDWVTLVSKRKERD